MIGQAVIGRGFREPPVRVILGKRRGDGRLQYAPAAQRRGWDAVAAFRPQRGGDPLASHVGVRVEQGGDAAGRDVVSAPLQPLTDCADLADFALRLAHGFTFSGHRMAMRSRESCAHRRYAPPASIMSASTIWRSAFTAISSAASIRERGGWSSCGLWSSLISKAPSRSAPRT